MSLLQTIERLEKLEKGATKGPWFVHGEDVCYGIEGDSSETFTIEDACNFEENNAFIAESRNAMPELIAALRKAHNLIVDVARLNFTYVMPRPEMPDKEMHMVVKKDTDQARRAKEFLKKHGLDERGGNDE